MIWDKENDENAIHIDNHGTGEKEVIDRAGLFARDMLLSKKEALHIILLAEETMGMIHEIANEFSGSLWITGDKNHCSLHLVFETIMDKQKKKELMSVSSSGKNIAVKGFMGKIKEAIEEYFLYYDDLEEIQRKGGMPDYEFLTMGMNDPMLVDGTMGLSNWSLQTYKDNVYKGHSGEQEDEAWDELEKSIVARIADDIQVGIKNGKVELLILRNF